MILPRQTNDMPVFFHSMWRTSSTWFFSRFRENSDYLAFYEPLNEQLIDLDGALRQTDGAEPSHPDLDRPYFDEYAGLREGGHPRGFNLNYCYLQRLLPGFDAGCRAYLGNLIAHAQAAGKQAFIQSNRTFLCMDCCEDFDSRVYNAYLLRNPRNQFASCARAGQVYYLGLSYLQFAAEARRNDSAALRFVDIPFYYSEKSFRNTLVFYKAFAELSTVTSYYVFFCLWCIGLIDAIRLGFPIIDTDAQRTRNELTHGVLDLFERDFPNMNLRGLNSTYYDWSEKESNDFAAVENLVIDHFRQSGYAPAMDDVRTCLDSLIGNAIGGTTDGTALFEHISNELRAATDANIAVIADGIQLGASLSPTN